MIDAINELDRKLWPKGLSEIPQPPHRLFIRGLDNFEKIQSDNWNEIRDENERSEQVKFLCVVGPRKHSDYGLEVCNKIIPQLSGFPICVVSGLAYGIDSIVHQLCLDNNIPTIAFPGSGLDWDVVYPRAHENLAKEIVDSGGCLISEFSHNFRSMSWMFPQRNRLMVGMSDATLIIEASEKSGTIITANMTVEYNRTLMSVPGDIFNPNCAAANRLIKEGAVCINSHEDVLENLGFDIEIENKNKDARKMINLSEREKLVLISFRSNRDVNQVSKDVNISINEINIILSKLELLDLI
jgi:DNA processing protein